MAFRKQDPSQKQKDGKKPRNENQPSPLKILLYCFAITAFFLILGGWWLANAFTEQNLFDGTWGIVLRVITAAALILLCAVFWKTYQKDRAAFEHKKKQEKETTEEAPTSSEDKEEQDQW